MTASARKRESGAEGDHLAGPAPEREQCAATTAKGNRCKRLALDGSDLCAVHLGAPVGRPAALTDKTADRICAILKVGGYVESAAAAAGVSKQTIYNWLERGDPDGKKKEDAPYRAFRQRVEQARAEGEAALVTRISIAGQKDWKADAWLLERQYPDRWAGPRGRSMSPPLGHPDDPPGVGGVNPLEGPAVVDDQVGPDGQPL